MDDGVALTSLSPAETAAQLKRSPTTTLGLRQSNISDSVGPADLQSTPVNAVEVQDVPPDGGYGWVCTACVFLINANTWGVNATWGVFLAKYLADSTFPGASQLEYALIGGLSISQCLLVSPLVALSNRTLGTKTTMLIGACLVAAAWLGASFATEIWHLFLTVGVCFGFGMGCLYITATAILPQWFLRRRSLAVGFASSGAGLGGLAYNLGAGAAIEAIGLAWTYRIIAICSLACNAICSILLKDRNKIVRPSQQSFDYRALGRVEVNLVVAWGFLTDTGYVILLFSLPHYATSIGLSTAQGSIVGAMLSLGLGLGRPLIGYYSDSFGRINMAGIMTALCGIYCLAIWIPATSFGPLVLFALLAGSVCGTFWGTVSAVAADVVGLQRLPSTFGIICMVLVVPTTFAEPLALQIVSASGYLTSQLFVAVLFLLGASCLFLLRAWKIEQIEIKAHSTNGRTRDVGNSMQWLKMSKLFIARHV